MGASGEGASAQCPLGGLPVHGASGGHLHLPRSPASPVPRTAGTWGSRSVTARQEEALPGCVASDESFNLSETRSLSRCLKKIRVELSLAPWNWNFAL